MTDERKELIERLAIEAQIMTPPGVEQPYDIDPLVALERFAELVRADALEEAAKVCEAMPLPYCRDLEQSDCADAIRKLIQSPLGK